MAISNDELKALAASLEGLEIARVINIAFFALTLYEWMITFDQEIEYFWHGQWSISRVLFFMNRYIPPVIILTTIITFSVSHPPPEFCLSVTRFDFLASILALGIVQAMLVARVWFLFSSNKAVRWGIIVAFIVSLAISLAFTEMATTELHILPPPFFLHGGPGCRIARPKRFWRMFMPSLVLHTILYILTAIRALRNRRILKHAPVLKRLLRDGGLFFFIVFVSVGFTAVGSFIKAPQINIPVIFSNYMLAVTSIAMSRIMFSIHSLASHLGSDAGWLLNNVELSRVDWIRKGSTEGEIVVERWVDDDADSVDLSALKTSRVGVFSDSNPGW